MSLSKEQMNKLDSIKADELQEETQLRLIRVSKIIQGEESLNEFEYEYDYDLDEMEYANIPLTKFKEITPTIYNKIIAWDGNQIFKAMENNKFTKLITNKQMHENKLKEIESNNQISKSKKDKQIAIRKQMRKEYENLKELNGKLNSNTCWKIWRIKEGEKVYKDIIENEGETKLKKEIEQVKYLGEDFIKECKEIAFANEEE